MARSRSGTTVDQERYCELEAYLDQPTPGTRPQVWAHNITAYSTALRPSKWFSQRHQSKQPLRRTAYLDGLRGFAALLVYCTHHHAYAHEEVASQTILNNAFGFNNEYYFVSFPLVRVFFSGGHTAVAIFFIISGYALSVKPLSLIHARDVAHLSDNLGSALFRRWLRLFIPVFCTTFIWMTSWHLLNIQSGKFAAEPPAGTYAAEVWKWYCDMKNYSFIFTAASVPENQYNFHTWTIPLEFRGSIVVYTSLLAAARMRASMRLFFEGCLVFYFLYIVDGYYCALFMMGMALCDFDMLAEEDQLPDIFSRFKQLPSWFYYLLMFASLYLAGVPSDSIDIARLRASPGWYILSFFKPQAVYDFRWFFRCIAGTFAIIAIPRIPSLKALFEGPFAQYLGKISYGFYLVHGPILWSLGDRLYAACGRIRDNSLAVVPGWINWLPMPNWGPFGLEVNYFIPHLILLPFTLWLAELVTNLIDEPSVKLAQRLFKASVGEGEAPRDRIK